jgi:hypothetical protein
VVKLLANKGLSTEDRKNLLNVDKKILNTFQRYRRDNPSFLSNLKPKLNSEPKPKSKSKQKYQIVYDEDGNTNFVHDNSLLTINSPSPQESNNLFSKPRKRHRSSDDNNIVVQRRKIDNTNNDDNNSIFIALQDFTHLNIPVGNYFQFFITFCKSGTSYNKQRCLFDKDETHICYLESSYLINVLLDSPFETQKRFNECFQKESVGKIYNAEEDKYRFFAIGKPNKFKELYFCRLIKLTLEILECDVDNDKVNKVSDNEKYVFLYRSDGKSCCIANMTGNNFEIVKY